MRVKQPAEHSSFNPISILKTATINIAVFTFLLVGCLEIYLRVKPDIQTSWTLNKSWAYRYKKVVNSSQKHDLLVLTVGDSFGAHQLGTKGNMFDYIDLCKDHSSCSYHNLSQAGKDTRFYWSTINQVLATRPKHKATTIIVPIYYGNDLLMKDSEQEHCGKVFLSHDSQPVQLSTQIQRYLPSLNFLQNSTSYLLNINQPIQEKSDLLIEMSQTLRNQIKAWKDKDQGVGRRLSRIDNKIISQAVSFNLNPWEIALALANPHFYEELYTQRTEWSQRAASCTRKSLTSNISKILTEYPNANLVIIGIPDKLYWNRISYLDTRQQYIDLGYELPLHPSPQAFTSLDKLFHSVAQEYPRLNYIFLPGIVKTDQSIRDYFYEYDMHINSFGNQELSKLLRSSLQMEVRKNSLHGSKDQL